MVGSPIGSFLSEASQQVAQQVFSDTALWVALRQSCDIRNGTRCRQAVWRPGVNFIVEFAAFGVFERHLNG
jgi:hypothetical protein